jgi:DNA-binding HxlR family transcriptional regulator
MPRTKKPVPQLEASRPRSRLIRGDAPKAPKPVTKTAKPTGRRSLCPINLVLEAVGDSWSMLIIRDLMLRGHTSYQAFLRSEEKIATNILADRLARLEQNGLITKSPDPADARKFIYRLTHRGADLAPLLVEMTLYSLKHETRIDMPKDVIAEMQKNKQAFASKLARHFTPRTRRVAKIEAEPAEETLSLF